MSKQDKFQDQAAVSSFNSDPHPSPSLQGESWLAEGGVSPWVFQYRVLKALVLRLIASEYGNYRLGYLIGIIFPIISMVAMIALFGLRGKIIQTDFSIDVFVITGYPLWQAFIGMYNKVLKSSSKSDSLLMFPQITQLDLIAANVIVFFASQTVIFVILCVGVIVLTHSPPPGDPLGVLFCFWGCMWIGLSVGLLLCPLQRGWPLVINFINTFLRFGMWVSGVIFTINRLPGFLRPYLAWNPILHCIEGARALWNPAFIAPIFNPTYVILIGFVLVTAGLVAERLSRKLVGS